MHQRASAAGAPLQWGAARRLVVLFLQGAWLVAAGVGAATLLAPRPARAQVFVQPQRPFKTLVHHYAFDWQTIDILVGETTSTDQVDAISGVLGTTNPAPLPTSPAEPTSRAPIPAGASSAKGGGVRLFFYKRERAVAERAAAIIAKSYRYLGEQFGYLPVKTFPYILYNTYQEFLETNLFPLQEGVLGVTSPIDLNVTLPYFGDSRLFEEVSTHELAHEFTIQKVRSAAKKMGIGGDPFKEFPLWFTEGLAEYYGQHGIDPEAEMLVRDIVVNPDLEHGYAMLGFFADRPGSVLWTYKAGQVRCGFLEDVYGPGTIQRILEQSPLLLDSTKTQKQLSSFAQLLERVTGDSRRRIAERFSDWIKRRSFRTYMATQQTGPELHPLARWRGIANSLSASPDGNLVLYRTITRDTGQSRLYLLDRRAPKDDVEVAADGGPGMESLHPVTRRNFDVDEHALVFAAQSGGADILYWQQVDDQAKKKKPHHADSGAVSWDIDLSLGERHAYALRDHGIVAADSPSFSPDGKRVAFVGLDLHGQKDIYVLTPKAGDHYRLAQLTHDRWSERQLSWGPGGIVYTSDATGSRKYNLFRVDPDHPDNIVRLTDDDRDAEDPLVTPGGRIFFVAYDHAHADINEVVGDHIVRRTNVNTGLFNISPGPRGGLWALWYESGRRRPVRVPRRVLDDATSETMLPGKAPRPLPRMSLLGAKPYDVLALNNWSLNNILGFVGASADGFFGQVLASASDRLNNHTLFLNAAIWGKPQLTDAYLLYLNQKNRIGWGLGAFHTLQFRLDNTYRSLGFQFTSIERFFGVMANVRYPFDTFRYAQLQLAVGGSDYFLYDSTRKFLAHGDQNGTNSDLLTPWRARNKGVRFQTQATFILGYDTIRYNMQTGPLAGSSLMLEAVGTTQPFNNVTYGSLRLDGEHYFPIYGSMNVFIRGAVGTTSPGHFAPRFYLSSFDTLRGVPFGDTAFLLGRHFFFTTAELQVPLNAIISVLFIPNLEGVLGVDFGAVGDQLKTIWDKRVLDVAVGVNIGLGPLVFRLHFAKPIGTGAKPKRAGVPGGLPNNGNWVTNFSLGWFYQ